MPTIYVVEDDPAIAELVRLYLRRDGHEVDLIADGALALRRYETADPKPDLLILDLMLPGLDGRGVARRVRTLGETPIVMLTALDDDRDKIEGLDLGADDYVVKPFNPDELVARVRAVLRRARSTSSIASGSDTTVVSVGNARVDLAARRLVVAGVEVALRTKEFDLLAAFAAHPGIVLSRHQLLDRVWGGEFGGDTRTVDVHVSRLRDRLAAAGFSPSIDTIRSVGYRLSVDRPPSS